jgi:hypothetical protein
MKNGQVKKPRIRRKPAPEAFAKTLNHLLTFSKADLDAAVKRELEQKRQK